MSKLNIRWERCTVVLAACLLMLVGSLPFAKAQTGAVLISDSAFRSVGSNQSQRFQDRRVRQAQCDDGCCDLGCCGDECCGDDCCGDGSCGTCCCCSPWWAHCSGISGEFLYLHVTDADMAHAQQQNGIGGAGTVPYGRIGRSAPHHEPGFRVGVAKAFTDCSSLVATYTFFESNSIDSLAAPVVPGGGGAVGSLVHHPGAAITASAGPVDAAYDVDFQLADIEYRAVWKATSCYAINWSIGGRYGNLVQDFRQLGVFSGGLTGVADTRANVDFDGGGLKFGLDGERRLGCGGFSIYARTSVSPLSGRFHADYRLNNNTGNVLLALADWEDDRIVTLLDYEAGLTWTGPCRRWRASAGYMGSFWFNTLTTAEFINTVQANSYDNADDTLKFEGLTARIERRW